MRPKLERLHQIEQHLLGHPSAEQQAVWRVQELVDADLAADTDLQRRVYQGLHVAGRQQLRRELAAIHEQLYGASRKHNALAFLTDLGQQLRRFFSR